MVRPCIHQDIALRWSAKQKLSAKFYRHLAPMEPELDTKATGNEFPGIN